jgi:ubiquinone/menaquinone biosynthesis C-methylase UbiE
MSSPTTEHFARVAATYDDLRPLDAGWWAVYDALVRAGDLRGQRVLELGCGTGRFAAALAERDYARVWAVDASPEMVALARESGATVKQAEAERLPFKAGWFDRVASRMAVHLFDRPRAFAEVRRVLAPNGRFAVATMDPDWFDDHWLLPWFPSLTRLDADRFPSAERLEADLAGAGFTVRIERLELASEIDREVALARIRGRAFSSFDLIPPDEYRDGLARAEAEFPERRAYRPRWLIAAAEA